MAGPVTSCAFPTDPRERLPVKAQLVRFAVQSKGVGAVATVGVPSAAPEIAEMCVSEVNARGSSLLLPSNYA